MSLHESGPAASFPPVNALRQLADARCRSAESADDVRIPLGFSN